MELFDRFKKERKVTPDFSEIDMDKAEELAQQGVLEPLYLMPPRFGGPTSIENRCWVPMGIAHVKDSLDENVVEPLVAEGKASRYVCTPEYKGTSVIPSSVTIVIKSPDQQPILTETIRIW